MTFTVQFNAGKSREALRLAAGVLKDMTPIYRDLGEYMVEATRARFLTGTAPDGSAWAPKSPATLERYRRMGYGGLTRPLIGRSKMLSRQILSLVTGEGVTVGSNLIYARVMQEGAASGAFGQTARGGPIPWGRIPARAFIGLSQADGARIVEIAEEHVENALGKGDTP